MKGINAQLACGRTIHTLGPVQVLDGGRLKRLERLGVQSKQCSVEVNVEVDAVLFLACSTRQIEYSAGSWLYDSMAMTQDGNGCDSGIDGCMEKLFPVKQTEERVWK